jgi:hypothetical protein
MEVGADLRGVLIVSGVLIVAAHVRKLDRK